jgi:hypothetical protein
VGVTLESPPPPPPHAVRSMMNKGKVTAPICLRI